MHLHGHEFQVVEINGQRFAGAVRDTVLVPPSGRIVVAFDANNPGWWPSTVICCTIWKRNVHDLPLRLVQQKLPTGTP